MDRVSGVCSFPECGRVEYRRGHCVRHRRQFLRGEELKPIKRLRVARGLICEFTGCGRPMYARGLCRKHHDQLIRGVQLHDLSPEVVTAFRRKQQRAAWAQMSNEEKNRRARGLIAGGRYERDDQWCKDKSRSLRGRPYANRSGSKRCVGCEKEFVPTGGRQIWCTKTCRGLHRKARNYKLELAELVAIEERQGGSCALCGQPGRLYVDHDHSTGRVRGLLCNRCNTGLGKLGEDVLLLRKAIRYLTA